MRQLNPPVMLPVSVVIITKNEAHILAETIRSVRNITDDILIVDSGSSDGTQALSKGEGAAVMDTEWKGFGPTKNIGIDAAKHDWILSIDADEQPDHILIASVAAIDFSNTDVVYNFRFKTFLGKKLIRYGEWGNDAHIRLFNKTQVKWNDAEVHEQLIIPTYFKVSMLNGYILHHTMKDVAEYATKMTKYALLSAERYYRDGKKATWVKRYLSAPFSFITNYIFKLGFLDGSEGYTIAKMTSYYTFLKYTRLHELHKNKAQ